MQFISRLEQNLYKQLNIPNKQCTFCYESYMCHSILVTYNNVTILVSDQCDEVCKMSPI